MNSWLRGAGARAALALLASLGLQSSTASAQTPSSSSSTITIGTQVIRRLPTEKAGVDNSYPFRDARRWWINHQECVLNEYFDFFINLTSPTDRLEVWAGTDNCPDKRSDQDHGQCWIVASNDTPMRSFVVSVPVRNIVANQVGTSSTDIPDPDALGTDICDESKDSDGVALTLYFFLQNGGKVVGTPVPWNPTNLGGVGYDMIGPAPPESISIGMGDSQLSINLEGVNEEPDRERFAAYCAESKAAEDPDFIPAADAAPVCDQTALMAGALPNPALKCGEANETSSTITTDSSLPAGNVENGKLYAVGVSGLDIIANAGPLSPLTCGGPVDLDDFFQLYKGAGGPGGRGYCSVSPGLAESGPGALALLGALLAVFGIRRGRSRA